MSSDAGTHRPVEAMRPDALERRRRAQRDPQAAVGGEALLRGEVVDVDVVGAPGETTGARRGVDHDQRAVVAARRSARRHRYAGGGLVVCQRVDVDPDGRRERRVRAGRAGDHDRVVEVRGRRRRFRELHRELAEREVLAPAFDDPEGGDVPERGGAAVAEHHLPAVGQTRRADAARCAASRPRTSPAPGGARCRARWRPRRRAHRRPRAAPSRARSRNVRRGAADRPEWLYERLRGATL